jgi:hypothetical protein
MDLAGTEGNNYVDPCWQAESPCQDFSVWQFTAYVIRIFIGENITIFYIEKELMKLHFMTRIKEIIVCLRKFGHTWQLSSKAGMSGPRKPGGVEAGGDSSRRIMIYLAPFYKSTLTGVRPAGSSVKSDIRNIKREVSV